MKTTLIFFLLLAMNQSFAYDFRKRAPHLANQYDAEDVEVEVKFGKNFAAKILYQYPLVDKDELQHYINTLGSYVVAQIGRNELQYHFGVIDSNEINAYALPGGFIFLTKGVVKQAGSEAALVGVLAHEIAHINQRHVVRELGLRSQSFLMGSLNAMSGAQTQAIRGFLELAINKAHALLFETGLKQADEFESDQLAFEFLTGIGIGVDQYIQLLEQLEKNQAQTKILTQTHPPMRQRVEILRQLEKQYDKIKMDKTDENRYRHITHSL